MMSFQGAKMKANAAAKTQSTKEEDNSGR